MTNFFLDYCNFVLGIFFTALALAFFAQRPCTAMIAKILGGANLAIRLSFLMNAFNGGSANPATRLSFLMTAFYVGSANLAIRLSFLMTAFYGGSANLATRLSFKMNATRPTHFRWPS